MHDRFVTITSVTQKRSKVEVINCWTCAVRIMTNSYKNYSDSLVRYIHLIDILAMNLWLHGTVALQLSLPRVLQFSLPIS